MKIHESAENYLEAILMLEKEKKPVYSVDVARRMGFSKASISRAMSKLRESGYIVSGGAAGLEMTKKGRRLAEQVLERHTQITRFLVKLGVSADKASEDACRIEHDICPETFECIKKFNRAD